MKLAVYTVVLGLMVSVDAAIQIPANGPDYFDGTLKSIQGALVDTMKAAKDLEVMEIGRKEATWQGIKYD